MGGLPGQKHRLLRQISFTVSHKVVRGLLDPATRRRQTCYDPNKGAPVKPAARLSNQLLIGHKRSASSRSRPHRGDIWFSHLAGS